MSVLLLGIAVLIGAVLLSAAVIIVVAELYTPDPTVPTLDERDGNPCPRE